jgi:hypothetical protein
MPGNYKSLQIGGATMKRKLTLIFAFFSIILCSCQSAEQSSTAYPPVATLEAAVSPVTEDELSTPIDNKPAFTPESEDLPVFMANGSKSTGFSTTSIDEFEMLMIDRVDIREQFGYSLTYYMPLNVPEGFSFYSMSCSELGISVSYGGPSLQYDGEKTLFILRAYNRTKKDLLEDLNSQVDCGNKEMISWNNQDYYVSKIIAVSPNDDGDTPGIKPQHVSIVWYDDALGQAFYVSIPNLTSFDPSLFRYCEHKTVVIDPERIDGLRPELLKSYSHEFPGDPERIAAEADFSAPDIDAFIEMFRQRADIREAYKYPLANYNPIWKPLG